MKLMLHTFTAIGLALALTACGGGGGNDDSTPVVEQKPTAVITSSTEQTTLSLKDGAVQIQLSADQSSSADNKELSYQWQLISRPEQSEAVLTSNDSLSTDFVADLPGEYVISLIVNDGVNNSEATRITFNATSPYPTAITEPVYSVSLGTTSVGLDASASLPPTGETGSLDYQWKIVEKPAESAGYLSNETLSLATLFVDVAGDYKLELVVYYGNIASEPKTVTVTVSSGNAPPVAIADDVTVKLGQTVTLDASQSNDPEGASLQYRWKWAYSPVEPDAIPLPELTGRTTDTLTFTPAAAGEYSLVLFVFDGARKSEEREVLVTVEKDPESNENKAPVGELLATGYFPSYSIGEQEVGLRAEFNFSGYDPEGEALQIISAELIEKPETSTVELVDIGSWKPMGKKIQKLDVEGMYKVRMVVSDGVNQLTTNATMEAKIGNVNGQPSTRGVDAQSKSVIVGDALVFDASSEDPNDDPMTFHWELVDRPDGSNAVIEPVIEPETQEYRRARVVTDVPGSYTARLIVEDDRGLFAKTYAEDDGVLQNLPILRLKFVLLCGHVAGEDYSQVKITIKSYRVCHYYIAQLRLMLIVTKYSPMKS
ncbi:PKD domain-containing protein [Pseudoalteromonas sp. GB43]